ncbi:hypothetical protein [Nocardia goodfellowii]|uniref:Drug/metabolite transporter (DMT)-like permease n=1 Tax=Nocardia goodfellowii TaxID=882446 RepID=A0ABS4QN62_9NOCA|nr:drug/metabolite transporter (DMT)-like permease [Nocardia goodfellowii]
MAEPLVAAWLAWLLLGQSLGPTQIVGVVIMLAGAVSVQLAMPEAVPASLAQNR